MRIWTACAAAAVAATVLTACGGSSGKDSTTSAASTATAAASDSGQDYTGSYGGGGGTAAKGTPVTVEETEFKLALSTTAFTPGTYTFTAKDAGHATHNLVIEGPGVGEKKSDMVSPGESTSLTVTLQKGTYELYCAVANHKNLGMKTEITVG